MKYKNDISDKHLQTNTFRRCIACETPILLDPWHSKYCPKCEAEMRTKEKSK